MPTDDLVNMQVPCQCRVWVQVSSAGFPGVVQVLLLQKDSLKDPYSDRHETMDSRFTAAATRDVRRL